MKTIVLLSGGIDSTTVLAAVTGPRSAIGFDYGQPHSIELEHARAIADFYQTPFSIIHLPTLSKTNDVVFAARNLMFVASAISYAQSGDHIAIGCNKCDWLDFPDCRPGFWQHLLPAVSQAYGVELELPLLQKTKRAVVELAHSLGVPLHLTRSCYSAEKEPCGTCLACRVRAEAMA